MLRKKENPITKMYQSAEWARTKSFIISRDAGRCQICKKLVKGRFIIHHIELATKENFFDVDNLELLDIECHNSITFKSGVKRSYDELYECSIDKNEDLIDFENTDS